jgi:hypothetical protein
MIASNVCTDVRAKLLCLASRIDAGNYPHDAEEWGGAGVVVTSRQPKDSGNNFYPEPRNVVTRFSREVSWLFAELRDAFAPLLDGCNKVEFYGRLANMPSRYKESLNGAPEQARDLLLAVLHEAFAMLEEMGEDRFEFLLVSNGNTILDDLIEKAERSGYLGVEATRRFFEEAESKFRDAS